MTRLQEFIKAIQTYAIIFAKQALTLEEHNVFVDKIWEGTKYPFKRTLTLSTEDDKFKAEVLVACYIDTVIEELRRTKEIEVLKKAMNEIEIEVQERDHRIEEDDPAIDEDPVEESDSSTEEVDSDQSFKESDG